jgi:hypothetical protein
MRKILFFLLSTLLCWQLSALDGPKNQLLKPPGYLPVWMMPVLDTNAFPVSIATVKGRLTDTLICAGVVASNFDTVSALQFTVLYDTSIVKLRSIKLDTALRKLSLDDFSTTPGGRISLVYSKQESAAGLNIKDGTRLYQLCFKPVKLGKAAIAFRDSVVKAEVLGPKGSKRAFKGEAGSVEIITCKDTTVRRTAFVCTAPARAIDTTRLKTANGCDSTVITTNVLRPGRRDTLINTTICEGQVFKVGPNEFRLQGLYIVNLKTSTGCDSMVQLALAVKSANITISGDTSVCSGKTTLIKVSGGTNYAWSNGATTDTVRLGPGMYTVTVRDTVGKCSGTRKVNITTYPPAPKAETDLVKVCAGAALPTLKVTVPTGVSANWFDVPTGGTPLARDTNSFKPAKLDTFYVEAIDSVRGCTNTERTKIVVQTDTLKPKFTACPTDIKKVIKFGEKSTTVTWEKPTTDDRCGKIKLSSNKMPGDTFPVGTTKVRYIIADSSSSKAIDSCIFNVVVETTDSLTFYIDTLGVTFTDTTINVPVKVRSFKAVQGFQFTVCVPVEKGTITGFRADTAALKGLDNFAFAPNIRTVNWFDAQSNGVTLKDSTTIFVLQIKANGGDCIPVQFKNKPSDIIATKTNLKEIVPTTIDGQACPPKPVTIAGKIFRENKVPIKFVTVTIKPDTLQPVITGPTGEYKFANLPYNKDHIVRPSLDSNHSGGVNILDVVLIQRHILAKDTFDTPYQWIAADVNKSGSITVADILNIRRLILGSLLKFPDNTSWRFVPEGFKFPDIKTTNPLTVTFPDSLLFKALKKDSLDANFIGIKVGDVNLSTNAQLRADETMEILIANRAFGLGEKLVVEVRASDLEKYAGYQFDLGFDREALEFVSVEPGEVPGVDRNTFNLNAVAEGRIPTLWYQTGASLRTAANPVLFRLNFNTRQAGEVAAALWLNQQTLPSMAVNQKGQAQQLKARFTNSALKVDLGNRNAIKALGVQPNPFKEQALIRFKLPMDSRTTLSIIDVAGREVYREARNLSAGVQEWTINGNTLGQSGVYHYRILTTYGVMTDKVVLTK